MLVVCINIDGIKDYSGSQLYYSKILTLGKVYDINLLENNTKLYKLIADDGQQRIMPWRYIKKIFKPLDEVRSDKINNLLE